MGMAGCFDSFKGFHRAMLFYVAPNESASFSEKAMRMVASYNERKNSSQMDLFGFGDEGGAEESFTIPLPICEPWSKMRELEMEKEALGFYISSHPMEVYHLPLRFFANCNIEMMTEAMGDIEKCQGRRVRLGGQITKSEEFPTKSNPTVKYGRYTIEDYTGSYQLVMFGNTYRQFAPLMQKNIYVLVTGIIQQRNAGSRWFKEAKEEEAEYEFMVQNVELLKDVQDKQTGGIRINLPISQVTNELVEELSEQIERNPGNGRVHLQVTNPINRHQVALTSRKFSIHITPHFYRWLQQKRQDGILSFGVITSTNDQ
jgi:DNA polymerase-3 subunit alpha